MINHHKLLMITNAHFYVNGSFTERKKLLIEDGIIGSFTDSDCTGYPEVEVIDMHGAYVYPGFIDSHTHSYSGGLYIDGIDLSSCKSISDVLQLIEHAKSASGDLLIAWRYDETSIIERRFPTTAELDSVCSKSKLLLRRVDGHSCILNTKARAAIPWHIGEAQVLTGAENDAAVNWLQDNCEEDTLLRAYTNAAKHAIVGGFTRIHTMIGDAEMDNQHFEFLASRLSDFPITFVPYPQSFNVKDAVRIGAKRIGGCILADGSIGSHTAALTQRYQDSDTQGNLYRDDDFWYRFIREATDNELQVGIHCIGDAAIQQINNAYLKVGAENTKRLRHQLIHCEITPDNLMEEIYKSGATPVMQPLFDRLWGGDSGFYAQRLGVERSRLMNRLGSFSRHGVRIGGSSDWYVTELNIAKSIHSAINHHNEAERLTPQQAIQIYTENNAWLDGDEDRLGRIVPGYLAELTFLNTDLTKDYDPEQCKTVCIIRNGTVTYA